VIEVFGEPGKPEHDVALAVRDVFCRQWPGIDISPPDEDHVKIASSIKLSGKKISDIDVVCVGLFKVPRYVIPKAGAKDKDGQALLGVKVRVKSFVVAIEVKDHPSEQMNIIAGGVSVHYRSGWKDATQQNDDQRYALLGYINDLTGLSPFVHRCLVLRGIEELPKHRGIHHPTAGAVPAKFDASTLLMAMATVGELRKHGGEFVISAGDFGVMERVLNASLLTPLKPSTLDRRRMDRIASRPQEALEIATRLGKERVHIRGNGGTGKTILLLQSAYEAFQSLGTRSLVLTYNTALAADIQRTLALMGIPGDGEAGGIRVRTVVSFMHAWLTRLGVVDPGEVDFSAYESKCAQALDLFTRGALMAADVAAAISSDPLEFGYDAILADEAQDWPQAEADLLATLYGPAKLALVDGVSQLVRGAPTNWQRQVTTSERQPPKSLKEGLRMKAGLCRFLNAFAEEAGFQWHVTPNKQAPGGRVIVLHGNYETQADLQTELLRDAIKSGNMPIDLLHCVAPSATFTEGGVHRSKLARAFAKRSWQSWDGVDDTTRRSFPRSTDELRIVQYESCRGLEGWTTVLDGFDEFLDLKRASALAEAKTNQTTADPVTHAEAVAWRWAMIPLTRPIDTLVITLRDRNSKAALVIDAVASGMDGAVQFLE
jgi:hypothetical protein